MRKQKNNSKMVGTVKRKSCMCNEKIEKQHKNGWPEGYFHKKDALKQA